jgi:hypothetical protein
MSGDGPRSGYPEPGHEGSLRHRDGDERAERTTRPAAPRESFSPAERAGAFVALSFPLLLGFYLWGFAVVTAWGVIPLAAWLGPRIWPALKGAEAASLAALVAAVVWLPAATMELNLLVPLCGTGFVGTVVPAALASAAYLVVGVVSALTRRVVLWIAAAPLVPVVYGLVSQWLDAQVTC